MRLLSFIQGPLWASLLIWGRVGAPSPVAVTVAGLSRDPLAMRVFGELAKSELRDSQGNFCKGTLVSLVGAPEEGAPRIS